jgi:hypothetical protein
MARFCEGLREQRTRPLTPPERARVVAARRSWTRTALARGALVPVALFSVVPLVLGASLLPPALGDVAGRVASLGALLVGFPLSILWVIEAIRVRTALSRDLAGGEVAEFGEGAPSLAVLPRSSRLLARDGAAVADFPKVEVGEAAEVPEATPTYGLAFEDAAGALAHGWVRRALAADEREELRRLAARLRGPPIRLAIVSVIFAALAARALVAGAEALGGSGLLLAFAVFLLGASWWRWLRGRRLAERLLSDEAEGWVVRATTGELVGTEVLPTSRVQWTHRGAPAAWRLRAGRSKLTRGSGA